MKDEDYLRRSAARAKDYRRRSAARAERHASYYAQTAGRRLSAHHPEAQSLPRPPRGLQEAMDHTALDLLPPAEAIRRLTALDVARAYGLDPDEV